MSERSTAYYTGFVIGAIAVSAAMPLLFIWALNTLFDLTIQYTWQTYLSALILLSLTMRVNTTKK